LKDGKSFRLIRCAVAIAQRDGRNVAIIIPEGAIIEVIAGPFNGLPADGRPTRRRDPYDVHERHEGPHRTGQGSCLSLALRLFSSLRFQGWGRVARSEVEGTPPGSVGRPAELLGLIHCMTGRRQAFQVAASGGEQR